MCLPDVVGEAGFESDMSIQTAQLEVDCCHSGTTHLDFIDIHVNTSSVIRHHQKIVKYI